MTRPRAILATVAGAVFAALLYLVIRHTRDLTDFEVYRTAGMRLLAGQPLYQPSDGHFVFKYLPTFAFALVPFAAVGAEAAKALWFALSFAWLSVFLAASVGALPDRRRESGALVMLTLLVTARVDVRELSLGQTNVLLGAMLVASFVAALRRARCTAGALVGAATFVKPYAIVLVPWLAAAVGPTALVACAGAMVIGLALPIVVYGWTGNVALLVDWFRTVTETTAPNLLLPENISFLSAWAKWIGAGAAATMMAVVSTIAVLALAGVVLSRRRTVRSPNYLEFALLLLIIPLLSPQGWDYMLLLGTPAVICLIDRWRDLGRAWQAAVVAAFVPV
ncbi:MAG: glycosyltransferase family 87 protein, partial [Gemmatimonadota bacterium]